MNLAVELIVLILNELDIKAIHVCMRVSKSFNALIKNSFCLQYHITLLSHGFIDGPGYLSRYPTTSSRQQALLDTEDSWFNLRPRMTTAIKEGNRCDFARFADGVWATYGSHQGIGLCLTLSALPSILAGTGLEDLTIQSRIIKLEANFVDFGVEPRHDLLILVEKSTELPGLVSQPSLSMNHFDHTDRYLSYLFHLRTLSQNRRHPKASLEYIELCIPLPPTDGENDQHFLYEVSGPVIVILMALKRNGTLSRSYLRVFNWETGDVLLNHDGGDRIISSFAYVTTDVLMLAEYVTPLTSDGPAPQLTLWSLRTIDFKLRLVKLQTLRLPPVKDGKNFPEYKDELLTLDEFNIVADSGLTEDASSSSPLCPFRVDVKNRIFLVALKIYMVGLRDSDDHPEPITFSICIPFTTILKAIHSGQLLGDPAMQVLADDQNDFSSRAAGDYQRDVKSEECEHIGLDWEDWGGQGACLNETNTNSYDFSVSGMRCSYLHEQGRLIVMDFSPSAIKKGKDARPIDIGDVQLWPKRPRPGDLGFGSELFDIKTRGEEVLFVQTEHHLPHAEGVIIDMEHVLILNKHNVDVWMM
ncbi:hypothetical protein SISNIDRAFT_451333 [Sistotremastrum niveocremeum HHB9708]|uniref:F-box domain-containing protein n=1 Tax=Sistotremastrum niveocremeum HHB9708 TaxID=1314777 RepID=A0A164X846_9AGAM|nr:hypothetical protein SISNIDRAFT_451333 [Sistotremastrum niveocremeum HHB9708]